jgi:Tol biopolymer transport system component
VTPSPILLSKNVAQLAKVAHYEIRSLLGAGGMGEVYLANDLRLHRPVALKVLRAHDRGAEATERFVREARAASALNHPNVAHIYEIGKLDDGVVYIAMEYVEGETLEARLTHGALPIEEAVDLAAQILDALVDAHLKGIVHRDLKPANIAINARGQAKVLDFGVAKRIREEPETPASMMLSDDLPFAQTEPNIVLGTIPYMSPEQTRAKPVDHRSDLFSFGVILYEMIAGARPFDGDGVLDTMVRIAEVEPPPIARDDVPAALRRVIAKCLEKDRDDRYATPAEALAELRPLRSSATPVPSRRGTIMVAAVLLIGLVTVAFVLLRQRGESRNAAPMRLSKLTTAAGLEDEPAISPDGRSIAYTSDEHGNLDIFVRPIAGGEAVRITDADADDAQPAWSPDGKRIAFVSARDRNRRLSIVLGQALGNFINAQGGDLFIVPAEGGAAVKLAENGVYPAWSADGRWIVFPSSRGGQWDLWKIAAPVDANIGAPVQLTNDTDFDYQPAWSPDGASIVYGSGPPGAYRLKAIAANGGTPRVLTDGKDQVLLNPAYAADGRAVFFSSTRGGSLNLWRLALDAKSEPEQITLGEGDDVNPSVAVNGERIVYATVRQTPDLWTLDLASGKAEAITSDTGREEFPHRAKSGVIVFASDRGGGDGLWLRAAGGEVARFVSRVAAGQPRWSPDGSRIAYRFNDNGKASIAIEAPGRADLRIVARDAEAPAWSPDGTRLAFTSWHAGKSQIYVIEADEKTPARQMTTLDRTTSYPTWSPDGRTIAFQATRDDGTRHIWLVDVATKNARPLTNDAAEDSHPFWSPVDADRILFVRNHENLMTVRVSTGRIEPLTRFTEPNMVVDYPSWSADGTKIDFSIARKRGDLYLLSR